MELRMTGNNVSISDALKRYAERSLRACLANTDRRVHEVEVRVADVNGPKGGIDKLCGIRVVLGMRTSHGSTIFMRSTAGAIMRGAGCQVLLIPTDVERVKRRTRVTSADRHLLSIPAPALSAGRAWSH